MMTRIMTTKLCLLDFSLVSHWVDSVSIVVSCFSDEATTRDKILSTGRKIFNLLKLRL